MFAVRMGKILSLNIYVCIILITMIFKSLLDEMFACLSLHLVAVHCPLQIRVEDLCLRESPLQAATTQVCANVLLSIL